MSEQEEPQEDTPRRRSAISLWNGWAIGMLIGLLAVAAMSAFFVTQNALYAQLSSAQTEISQQHHYLAIRRACHNQDLVPRLCALRQHLGLNVQTSSIEPRAFGPDNLLCSQTETPPPEAQRVHFCQLLDVAPTSPAP